MKLLFMNVENNLILQQITTSEPELSLAIKDSIGFPTSNKINQTLQTYNQANNYLIGAFIKQQLVGVIGFEVVNQIIRIRHISVLSDFRKQKIGKSLVQHIIKQYSWQEVKCETDQDSVEFYKKLGFECTPFQGVQGVRYGCWLRLKERNHLEKKSYIIHSPATIKNIADLLKTVDQNTLVIWDVDGVLLTGVDRIFHSENIHNGLVHKYTDYIANKYKLNETKKELFISQLLLQRQAKLVDTKVLDIMQYLQYNNIPSIALTHYFVGTLGKIKSVADWRINELANLKVKFNYALCNRVPKR